MNKLYALSCVALSLTLSTITLRAQSPQDSLETGSVARSFLTIPEPQTRQSNIIAHSQYLALGGIKLGNTYLSPLNYGGRTYSFISERTRLGYRSLPEASSATRHAPLTRIGSAIPCSQ